MFALRPIWIAALLLSTGTLTLVSANEAKENFPSGKEYDEMCSKTATEHGVANAHEWTWSSTKGICENNAKTGETPPPGEATAPSTRGCAEGFSQCLQDCGQYNPTDVTGGGLGAWAGCRASCSYRCDSGRGGCWRGWCWAGCATGFPFVEGIEWCYTTRGWSQDYQYVRCNHDSDCNKGWACAGPCAAF